MRKTGMATNVLAWLSIVALASCGGSASEGDIQGTVSGLGTGLSVTLQDNGADNLTLATNGTFGFDTGLPAGGAYNVTVLTQPVGQTCFVANASGTLGNGNGTVSTVEVVCSSSSSVSGTVSGLAAGTSVTLSNGGVLLPVAANGAFAFPGMQAQGSTYDVSIAVQPVGQTCSVANASGVVFANVAAAVEVTCQ